MPKFSYLPGLIMVALLEYALALYFFGNFRLRFWQWCKGCLCDTGSCDESIENVDETFDFESTYESFHPKLKYVLFATRIASFIYILSVSVLWNYFYSRHQWFYFTLWNAQLLSLYYLLSSICSAIGLYSSHKLSDEKEITGDVETSTGTSAVAVMEPIRVHTNSALLGRITRILFEICGGSSFFVTVVNFAVINHDMSFRNISAHLIPFLTLLIELIFNNMSIRVDHFTYNVSFAMTYLIFIWPLVVLGSIPDWPYPFLAVDTADCYAMYTLLFLLDILFYFSFYSLSSLKHLTVKLFHNGFCCNRTL